MENTNANITATTPAAVEPTKVPSKMALCRPIFQQVTADGAELPEGKSARATFIDRAQSEIGMTAKGAATYFQNLTKEAKGEPLYSRKKKEDEVATPTDEVAPVDAVAEDLDAAINEVAPTDVEEEQAA